MSRRSTVSLPSYAGRTAVVTGGNSGIGRHTAAALAAAGAHVVLACRDVARAQQVATALPGDVTVEQLDLSSLASVEAFAGRWAQPLDLLVNNAGVMRPPAWTPTEDGHELQLGTNHLGHMALTSGLLPWLLKADQPRVVTVASVAHHSGSRAVLDGNPRETYAPEPAYGNSKLANLLFARELQRRDAERGLALTSVAAHPGVAYTGLVTDRQGMGANPVVRLLAPVIMPVFMASALDGAQPTLYAAAHAEPGSYTGPQGRSEWRGPVGPARLSAAAADDGLAAELWERSEQWLGRPFAWA